MPQTARQATPWPTRKLSVATLGNIGLNALMSDAIKEAWPQMVAPALAGEAVTIFVAAAVPAFLSLVIAYFVPDAPNSPEPSPGAPAGP